MTPTEAAYIAGMVDGEGCITINVCKYKVLTPHISITNTNKEVLDWILEKVKLGKILSQARPSGLKPCWHYTIRVPEMKAFIQSIQLYLIVKKEQAELLLEFLEQEDRLMREVIQEEIAALNKRGSNARKSI